MRQKVLTTFFIVFLTCPGFAHAETSHFDMALRPGNTEVWTISAELELMRAYDTGTLNVLFQYTTNGQPVGFAFDAAGNYVYVAENDLDSRVCYVRCYNASDGTLVSETVLSGIAWEVFVHSNGDIYVTSQDPMYDGYIERFAPLTLTHLATGDTGAWPTAIAESSLDGSILVGSGRMSNTGSPPDIKTFTRITCHDSINLAVVNEYDAGIQQMVMSAVDNLLVIQNYGTLIVDPEYSDLIKGLTIIDLNDGSIQFEWQILPDIVRGSCYETLNSKWFGCTLSSEEPTGSKLWMICDLNSPEPIRIEEFPANRVVSMVAFPIDPDTVRLIGIDSLNEALWAYDADANAPPEADFTSFPPSGPAPLEVTITNSSFDCDGDIIEIYADWDNDGIPDETIPGSPPVIIHEFTAPGAHIFVLTVVDDDCATDDWTGTVVVG